MPPRKAEALSAGQVRQYLTRPGLHAVGGVAGLHLQVTPTGAASWVLRITIAGKRRDIGLGGYPDTTLKGARDEARDIRIQVRKGIDPIAARNEARDALRAAQASRLTFDDAARQCLASKRNEFRNAKHAQQWANTLSTYASPVIGKLPVSEIGTEHVVKILEPIWTEKTETAVRLRGRIEAVLAWATVRGYRKGDNPARWRGHLDAVLPKPTKVRKVQHFKALPVDDLGAFMERLRAREGMGARALEFAILTATRSNEVRGATWPEIDSKARTWTIPAERMKAERDHVVPLSDAAVELLEALPRYEGTDLIFPSAKGKKLSDQTMTAVLRRMGEDVTAHGFRSTFSDWCSERTGYPSEVREMALAHTIPNKAEKAYRRGDLLTKRRRLMDDWARFCATVESSGSVTPIREAQ